MAGTSVVVQWLRFQAPNTGDVGLIPGQRISSHIFLPGESHGQRSLVGYSPWGRRESDMTERLHLHLQEWINLFRWTNSVAINKIPLLIKRTNAAIHVKVIYCLQNTKETRITFFHSFFSLWFCTLNNNRWKYWKMAKLLLELHTGRVHSHKTEQHSAVGLPFLPSQGYFTNSIYTLRY